MLAAVQFRLRLDLGKPLGPGYRDQLLVLFVLLFVANYAVYLVSYLTRSLPVVGRYLHPNRQFRLLILAGAISAAIMLAFMPALSQLQVLYYSVVLLVLGTFLILLPGRFRRASQRSISVIDDLRQIREHRYLVQVWSGYRIRARYTQTFLGILWIVLDPILESLVLAFAFSQLLGRGDREGVPLVLFILSGRVTFLIFQKLVMASNNAIQKMSGVIQQVYFPREMIIMLLSTEVMVDFLFAFGGYLVVALLYGITPNIYYLLLPIPIFLMLLLAMGVSFVVAWLSLLVRDIRQLVVIGMQLLFYVTVLYDSTNVTSWRRLVPIVNPVSAMVEAARSIVLYNQMPDFVSLYFPTVLSIALLYTGYVFYKVNEDRFTDYL